MWTHVKSAHKTEEERVALGTDLKDEDLMYKCLEINCGKKFILETVLEYHQSTSHKLIKPFNMIKQINILDPK